MIEPKINSLSGDWELGLDKFTAKVKDDVILSGVAAAARVIYDELKLNTSGARQGGAGKPPGVVTGTLHDAVYRAYSPERSTEFVKIYHISVNKSKAPHWALLEYGTSKMSARPYLRPAFDRMGDAIKAGSERMKDRMAGGT